MSGRYILVQLEASSPSGDYYVSLHDGPIKNPENYEMALVVLVQPQLIGNIGREEDMVVLVKKHDTELLWARKYVHVRGSWEASFNEMFKRISLRGASLQYHRKKKKYSMRLPNNIGIRLPLHIAKELGLPQEIEYKYVAGAGEEMPITKRGFYVQFISYRREKLKVQIPTGYYDTAQAIRAAFKSVGFDYERQRDVAGMAFDLTPKLKQDRPISSLMLSSSHVDGSYVADGGMLPLLALVPFHLKTYYFQGDHVYKRLLASGELQRLHLQLMDDNRQPIRFEGTLTIVLHIRHHHHGVF